MRWLGLFVAGLLACTADNPAFDGETESSGRSTTAVAETGAATTADTTAAEDSSGEEYTCDDIEPGQRASVSVIAGAAGEQICAGVNISGRLDRANLDGPWQIVCDPECGTCEGGPYTLEFGNGDPQFNPDAGCVIAFGSYDAECTLSFFTITQNNGQVIHYAAGTARSIDDPVVSSFLDIDPIPLRTCDCDGDIPDCCRREPGRYALRFKFLSIDETLEQGDSVVVDGGGHDLTLRNLRSHVLRQCGEPNFDWVAMP